MKRFIFFVIAAVLMSTALAQMTWNRATAAAQWAERDDHAVVVFHDTMWLLGGWQSGNMNDIWYSTDGATWVQALEHAAWSARNEHSAVVFGDKMWVIGGNFGTLQDAWYSSDGVNWFEQTPPPPWSARSNQTSLVYEGKMWMIGGLTYGDRPLPDVWFYTDTTGWVKVADSAPWAPRVYHASVVFDNAMWVLGGKRDGLTLNDAWRSTDGLNWTKVTDSFPGRFDYTALVFDDKIWVLGGWVNNKDGGHPYHNSDDVWWSSDGCHWQLATDSAGWTPRSQHASVVFGGRMWTLGGNDGWFLNDVWWSSGIPGIEERHATSCGSRLAATIVRRMFFLPEASGPGRGAQGVLLDISGRKVLDLRPGPNDVSGLAPGVYFVRGAEAGKQDNTVRKVIIQR